MRLEGALRYEKVNQVIRSTTDGYSCDGATQAGCSRVGGKAEAGGREREEGLWVVF